MTTPDDIDILSRLASDDVEVVQQALAEVHGEDSFLVQINTSDKGTGLVCNKKQPTSADVARMFGALLWAAQKYGAALGMQLDWVRNAQQEASRIQVVKPGQLMS